MCVSAAFLEMSSQSRRPGRLHCMLLAVGSQHSDPVPPARGVSSLSLPVVLQRAEVTVATPGVTAVGEQRTCRLAARVPRARTLQAVFAFTASPEDCEGSVRFLSDSSGLASSVLCCM